MAFILVIVLAVFSPLFTLSGERAARVDMNIPHQVTRVADLARPRPEVRIERVLKLEEFLGFDPDLAALLINPREQRLPDDSQAVEQLAFLSPEHGRDSAP
ncbi:MAG TPA: hypothetical protein VF553_19690 [Pyrinomonadaceae bacterium]|jgi:hypothetical protein